MYSKGYFQKYFRKIENLFMLKLIAMEVLVRFEWNSQWIKKK